jgi:hypothetical protein
VRIEVGYKFPHLVSWEEIKLGCAVTNAFADSPKCLRQSLHDLFMIDAGLNDTSIRTNSIHKIVSTHLYYR